MLYISSLLKHQINPIGHKIGRFWLKLPVRHRGLVLIAIPITCSIASLIVFSILQLKLLELENRVERSEQIHSETERLLTTIINAETGVQSYLITGKSNYLNSYKIALTIIPDSYQNLQPLIRHNAKQQERFEKGQQSIEASFTILKELEQKRNLLATNSALDLSLDRLDRELENSQKVIKEAKWYLYLIATIEERHLIGDRHNLEEQKQVYWLLLGIVLIIDTIASIFAIYLIFHLDKELAQRENHLDRSNRLLSQVNEQLQLFTANASHELRAPLAAILSNAQVGLLAPPDDFYRPRQRLAKIVTIAKSMSELITNLLFLARQENILESTYIETINLVYLLSKLAEEFFSKLT